MTGKGDEGRGKGVIEEAASAVAGRLGKLKPRVAIVLGSGLGAVADAVQSAIRIPQSAIPGFPEPGAPGHKGELVAGTLEGVPLVVQSGRFHLYEGHPADVAALPTRVFARLGVETLIVTNAAAGLSAQTLSHAEVLEASARVAGQLERLIRGVLKGL